VVLQRPRQLDEAIRAYQAAIRIDRKYVMAHSNLGTVLADTGRLNEAIAAYQTAIDLNPEYVPAHFNLGNALAKQRRWDEAITAFRTAVRLDPKDARSHIQLGAALASRGRLDEAIAAYRTAIRLKPKGAGNNGNGNHEAGLEGAVAVPQEHAHTCRMGLKAFVRGDEVRFPVAVDIRHDYLDGPGLGTGGEVVGGLEGAVAVAQQHAHLVVVAVSRDDVGAAVAVEIRHR
jgi:tetratricopeptide (TPR) repeat protein